MKYPHFLERDSTHHNFNDADPKLIAFYLPQFHPIPENDKIWEKNFTEWTNVTKATPLFEGHYQPRLPYECGFYDLRNIDTIRWQADLSRQYGVYGWMIMYYFFDGKVIMDTPLKLILDNPDISINFCLEWANEPWTRKWDGTSDITIPQGHDCMDQLIRNMMEVAKDERYIRHEGRPVIIVYRDDIIPDIVGTINLWRRIAREEYNESLYIIIAEAFDNRGDPLSVGFDAALQYPPHPLCDDFFVYTSRLNTYLQCNSDINIFSYGDIVMKKLYDVDVDYPLYRTVTLDWDNTSRRGNIGTVIYGCSPALYYDWLHNNIKHARSNGLPFTFINAWNEWAEGTYLEPDRASGYRYLFETRRALNE